MEDMEDPQAQMDALKSYVLQQSDDAASWIDTDVAPDRARATKYYKGEKFGNEQDGRSQIVLTEVRDSVGAILPSLMRVFFSGERAVEFIPTGPEDIALAEQATDYVNFIFQKDNPGFEICYSVFKDALVRRTGIVKYWWDEEFQVTTHEFSGLTDQALAAVLAEEGAELIRDEMTPDPSVPVLMDEAGNPVYSSYLHDCTVRRTKKKQKVSLAAVPPEEFLINRSARSLDDARYVEHRTEKTRGEFASLGYDPDSVNFSAERTLQFNQEAIARNPSAMAVYEPGKTLYRECWVRYDLDEDGIDELLKVCVAGKELLHVEPTDEIPFAVFCPDPEPHTFFGLSDADKTMDLQESKSFVLRNAFNSMEQTISPRMVVVEGQVNMADVLNNEVGAVIRARAPGMVQELVTTPVFQQSFPMLSYLDEIKEQRTGQSKASLGLDADALQSTTKTAVAATVSAAQGRQELVARIFAETGMKRMFKGILRLICRNQDKARMVRLRNTWVEMDPASWNSDMDVTVNVAIGAGTVEDRIGFLGMIAAKQEQILQLAGMDNPLVSPINLYNTYGKMLELSGWKDTQMFFTDPRTWEPPEPKPDPAEMLAQLQMEDIRGKLALEAEKLRNDREKSIWEQDFKRDQLDADIILKSKEMELQYKTSIDATMIKAQVDKARKDSPSVVVTESYAPQKRTRKVPIRDSEGEIIAVDEVPIE
jgi:hypothetical protein